MRRFFIDTHDGEQQARDDDGEHFESVEEAKRTAISHLPGIADAALPDGEHRVFRAVLRDEAGAEVYVATLTFHGEWQAGVPPHRAELDSPGIRSGARPGSRSSLAAE